MNPLFLIIWQFDDGGRSTSGFKGLAPGDCSIRAIAIATQKPYREVYDDINELAKSKKSVHYSSSSSRTGVTRKVFGEYLKSLGWIWVPTVKIGTGCKVHLKKEELPSGRLVVLVSKHLTTMIDGVIHDLYDPSRGGTRCVYGYYYKP